MTSIFVDCGANIGQSIDKFSKIYKGYDFYAFEPNPALHPQIMTALTKIKGQGFLNPSAVGTHDGYVDFFLGSLEGSTTMQGKVEYWPGIEQVNYTQPTTVPCIDLSRWLRSFSGAERIVVKMDIEGGEYSVVPKLLEDGTIDLIDEFYCEWHQDRFPDIPVERHHALVQAISARTVLKAWS